MTPNKPTTPEQFLREFAAAIMAADLEKDSLTAVTKEIQGWAKLLELREQEARLDTFEFCINNFKSKAYIMDEYNRLKRLTTPNNATNTLEDEVTE